MKMNTSKSTFGLILLAYFLNVTAKEKDVRSAYYPVDKCADNSDCDAVCGFYPYVEMKHLCDYEGSCICNCSNMTAVDEFGNPPACQTYIPTSEAEECSQHCQVYGRYNARICGEIGKRLYCVGLCKWY